MLSYNLIIKFILSLFFLGMIPVSFSQAQIVSSVKPIGFITAAIADGVTDTEVLLPDGASPHSYSLKPSDLVKLKSADLVIWIGKDMETFLPKLLRNIDSEKQIELTTNSNIMGLLRGNSSHDDEKHNHDDHDHDHDHGQSDMHIWLSPEIAEITARIIHDKLITIYPDKSKIIDKNLQIFVQQLKETEQVIAKKLNSIQNKGYFVFHNGYGYFESEFNLNNLGSFTINPAIQPGVKKVYEIQKELNNKNAVCVFREPQFSPAIINKLVDGTDVKVGELDPLGMNIELSKNAYSTFLLTITEQFLNCLE